MLIICYHLYFQIFVYLSFDYGRGQDAEHLICGNRKPDFVLDCIDDVNTKAELISFCRKNLLQIITSMGAGGKADPTKLRIGSLADCVKDPLASKVNIVILSCLLSLLYACINFFKD